MKLREVDLSYGQFTGPLKHAITSEPKLCDVCGKEKAMWLHPLKRPKGDKKNAYLCFGCGDH